MTSLINRATLIPGKRMGVIFFKNFGDWYSLCSTLEYAENKLNQKYILFYTTDVHKEVANWFSYGSYSVELFYLTKEEYDCLYAERTSKEFIDMYGDYVITW